eukprot:scaffold43614_cov88-Phaeocystis_antarctica.AAC.2
MEVGAFAERRKERHDRNGRCAHYGRRNAVLPVAQGLATRGMSEALFNDCNSILGLMGMRQRLCLLLSDATGEAASLRLCVRTQGSERAVRSGACQVRALWHVLSDFARAVESRTAVGMPRQTIVVGSPQHVVLRHHFHPQDAQPRVGGACCNGRGSQRLHVGRVVVDGVRAVLNARPEAVVAAGCEWFVRKCTSPGCLQPAERDALPHGARRYQAPAPNRTTLRDALAGHAICASVSALPATDGGRYLVASSSGPRPSRRASDTTLSPDSAAGRAGLDSRPCSALRSCACRLSPSTASATTPCALKTPSKLSLNVSCSAAAHGAAPPSHRRTSANECAHAPRKGCECPWRAGRANARSGGEPATACQLPRRRHSSTCSSGETPAGAAAGAAPASGSRGELWDVGGVAPAGTCASAVRWAQEQCDRPAGHRPLKAAIPHCIGVAPLGGSAQEKDPAQPPCAQSTLWPAG